MKRSGINNYTSAFVICPMLAWEKVFPGPHRQTYLRDIKVFLCGISKSPSPSFYS